MLVSGASSFTVMSAIGVEILGASLMLFTVTVNVSLMVLLESSVADTIISAVPNLFVAKLNVRELSLAPIDVVTNELFDEVATNVSADPFSMSLKTSFKSTMLVSGSSSFTVTLAIGVEIVGVSLIGATLIVIV